MKNIFRTSMILLLVLGFGVSAPKIMNSRAVDYPMSESGVTPEGSTITKAHVENNESTTLENKSVKTEITAENTDFTQETEENLGNFPIETDSMKNALEVEPKVESALQKELKDDINSKVDNTVASFNDTEKSEPVVIELTEELRTPETAPRKKASKEISASYDRYVRSSLNLRKGPGTSYSKVATLKAGDKVHVTAVVSNGWSLIEINGMTGYVSNSYLLKESPVTPAAAKPQAPPQKPSTAVTAPAPTPTPVAPKEEPTTPAPTSYSAYRMIVGGRTIPYKNGGMSGGQGIIDRNNDMISTWGGAETYSGSDNFNTHFIGHNPGIFSVLLKLPMGSIIVVTDGNAVATTYVVTKIFKVDDFAYNKEEGVNYYNYLASPNGGEVITLQTCLSSDENLIIRAEKR